MADTYSERCTEKLETLRNVTWDAIADIMRTVGLQTCGRRTRLGDRPWLRGRDVEIRRFKERISAATREIHRCGELIPC